MEEEGWVIVPTYARGVVVECIIEMDDIDVLIPHFRLLSPASQTLCLSVAVIYGAIKCLAYLITVCDVNSEAFLPRTLINMAVDYHLRQKVLTDNRLSIIKMLLKAGCRVDTTDRSPLDIAMDYPDARATCLSLMQYGCSYQPCGGHPPWFPDDYVDTSAKKRCIHIVYLLRKQQILPPDVVHDLLTTYLLPHATQIERDRFAARQKQPDKRQVFTMRYSLNGKR